MIKIPEKKTVNASFTIEGPLVYELAQTFAGWLAKADKEIKITHMRYDYNFTPEVEKEEKADASKPRNDRSGKSEAT